MLPAAKAFWITNTAMNAHSAESSHGNDAEAPSMQGDGRIQPHHKDQQRDLFFATGGEHGKEREPAGASGDQEIEGGD